MKKVKVANQAQRTASAPNSREMTFVSQMWRETLEETDPGPAHTKCPKPHFSHLHKDRVKLHLETEITTLKGSYLQGSNSSSLPESTVRMQL